LITGGAILRPRALALRGDHLGPEWVINFAGLRTDSRICAYWPEAHGRFAEIPRGLRLRGGLSTFGLASDAGSSHSRHLVRWTVCQLQRDHRGLNTWLTEIGPLHGVIEQQ